MYEPENTFTTSTYQITVEDLDCTDIYEISLKMDNDRAWAAIAEEVILDPWYKGIIKTLDYNAICTTSSQNHLSSPTKRLIYFLQKIYPNTEISSFIQVCYSMKRFDIVKALCSISAKLSDDKQHEKNGTWVDEIEREYLSQEPKRMQSKFW